MENMLIFESKPHRHVTSQIDSSLINMSPVLRVSTHINMGLLRRDIGKHSFFRANLRHVTSQIDCVG